MQHAWFSVRRGGAGRDETSRDSWRHREWLSFGRWFHTWGTTDRQRSQWQVSLMSLSYWVQFQKLLWRQHSWLKVESGGHRWPLVAETWVFVAWSKTSCTVAFWTIYKGLTVCEGQPDRGVLPMIWAKSWVVHWEHRLLPITSTPRLLSTFVAIRNEEVILILMARWTDCSPR